MFSWGGCGGVVPFDTEAECLATKCDRNPCILDPDPGPCKAAIPKWFYNEASGVCSLNFHIALILSLIISLSSSSSSTPIEVLMITLLLFFPLLLFAHNRHVKHSLMVAVTASYPSTRRRSVSRRSATLPASKFLTRAYARPTSSAGSSTITSAYVHIIPPTFLCLLRPCCSLSI